MTGYIYICEKCNGYGYHWFYQSKINTQIIKIDPGTFIKYTGKPPVRHQCSDCDGRGYW